METLKRTGDFDRIFRRGKSHGGRALVLYLYRCRGNRRRVGFCVSRKVGKAVIRNRVRRRLREVYRRHQEKIRQGCDLILLARKKATEASYRELEEEFLNLAEKAGAIYRSGKEGDGVLRSGSR